MPLNVESFKNKLVFGGARNSKYRVELTPPLFISNRDAALNAPYFCRAASLPESTMTVIEVPYQGRVIKEFGERTFANWNTTFYNDESNGEGLSTIRDMLFAWSNRMNGMESNLAQVTSGPQSGLSYKGSAVVVQVTKQDVDDKRYTLVGLWPVSVSSIELSFDQANTIQEFQVEWAYDYWVPEASAAPGASINILDSNFAEVKAR
jgi:hypothetical protein